MTNREFFTAIANANLNEEITSHALGEIAKLDKRNEHKKVTLTPTQKENEVLKVKVLELVKGAKMVASEIAKSLEISTQKASALARQLAEEGKLSVGERKVKGKGAVKEYFTE